MTRPGPDPVQRVVLGTALLLLVALCVRTAAVAPRLALLALLGAALGVTLYHAAFGFAAAYRRLLCAGDSRGVDAQLVMLAVAMLLFAPVLAGGGAFGRAVVGAVAPLGVSVAVGAFLFGIGMQLANGCGSGSLYALGGGSTRMLATLPAFVAGSFAASLHMGFWQDLPGRAPIVLGEVFGWPAAVALQGAVLAALWWALRPWRRAPVPVPMHLLRGPWPLFAGALLLALLNLATLLVAGHPWTITWAFTLWGAKLAVLLGWDPAASPFWQGDFPQAALAADLLSDATSVMDLGLILGASCAAALAGRYTPPRALPARAVVAALLGGVLMGYGARIAYGCNVGAFFSGVASTSLHGWLWILAALPGVWLGARLRPRFGLVD